MFDQMTGNVLSGIIGLLMFSVLVPLAIWKLSLRLPKNIQEVPWYYDESEKHWSAEGFAWDTDPEPDLVIYIIKVCGDPYIQIARDFVHNVNTMRIGPFSDIDTAKSWVEEYYWPTEEEWNCYVWKAERDERIAMKKVL